MISKPPTLGHEWTREDRLTYIAWVCYLTLERIDLDDPTMPVLRKQSVRDLFHAIQAVASWPPEILERDRVELMKPYDSRRDQDGGVMPAKLAELINQFEERDR